MLKSAPFYTVPGSFKGPIRARIVETGEAFNRFTGQIGSKGRFLTKSDFGSPAEAVSALRLGPFGNPATVRQSVTATKRNIVLEGGIKKGKHGVKQSLVVNQASFDFSSGTGF